MNGRNLRTAVIFLLHIGMITSCNRGKVKLGKGGEIEEGTAILKCEMPRKPYTKEIEALVKKELNKLKDTSNVNFEMALRTKVIQLTDYSTKGLDLDLLLFRICEMSINRGVYK